MDVYGIVRDQPGRRGRAGAVLHVSHGRAPRSEDAAAHVLAVAPDERVRKRRRRSPACELTPNNTMLLRRCPESSSLSSASCSCNFEGLLEIVQRMRSCMCACTSAFVILRPALRAARYPRALGQGARAPHPVHGASGGQPQGVPRQHKAGRSAPRAMRLFTAALMPVCHWHGLATHGALQMATAPAYRCRNGPAAARNVLRTGSWYGQRAGDARSSGPALRRPPACLTYSCVMMLARVCSGTAK